MQTAGRHIAGRRFDFRNVLVTISPMRNISAFLALSLLAACATGPSVGPVNKNGSSPSEEAAIATALQQIATQKTEYKISPADLLDITVYQNADLNRQVRVSQDGRISFPLVGTVSVGGRSTIDAERALSDKLKDYLINPQVSIFIKEYGNKTVYVLGQVTKPGSYALPTESKLTVLEAVSLAGGFTPIAAPDRTKVIRNTAGKSETFTIEVSAITKRGDKEKDVALEPNDIVFVPQSFF